MRPVPSSSRRPANHWRTRLYPARLPASKDKAQNAPNLALHSMALPGLVPRPAGDHITATRGAHRRVARLQADRPVRGTLARSLLNHRRCRPRPPQDPDKSPIPTQAHGHDGTPLCQLHRSQIVSTSTPITTRAIHSRLRSSCRTFSLMMRMPGMGLLRVDCPQELWPRSKKKNEVGNFSQMSLKQ